jgi:hypothetical protein
MNRKASAAWNAEAAAKARELSSRSTSRPGGTDKVAPAARAAIGRSPSATLPVVQRFCEGLLSLFDRSMALAVVGAKRHFQMVGCVERTIRELCNSLNHLHLARRQLPSLNPRL